MLLVLFIRSLLECCMKPNPKPPAQPPPPPAADYRSRDNFWKTFWISFILEQLLALTYRFIDYLIKFWSILTMTMTMTLNYQGQVWNLLYLSNKSGPIATKRKQTYRLLSSPQMWTMGLTLAMTLAFEPPRSNVTLTIWWPRSGVRICQNVTGLTSAVGVPSTLPVIIWWKNWQWNLFFILYLSGADN